MTTPTMTGKVCVVTGATSGIGQATATGLATAGATLVLVGRDSDRCHRARAAITAETGNANIDILLADLTSQAEIRRLAEQILSRHSRLDVLVNNAGAVFDRRAESVDGIERTFALNHLAYFLLTNLLLDRLRASKPARIVNVTSEAQRAGRIDFNDLQATGRYRTMRAYSQSKLANVLFTVELAHRLDPTDVTVNCVHPGAVRTRFGHGTGGTFGLLVKLARPFERTPAKGAETVMWLATAPELAGVSGHYWADKRLKRPNPAAEDHELTRRLWEVSAELAGLDPLGQP